jgi:hypothetical protein
MELGNRIPCRRRPVGVKRIALLLASLALVAAACGAEPGTGAATTTTTTPDSGGNAQLGELAAAQGLWVDAAPADYTVTQIDLSPAAADQPQTVAVHEGELVSLAGEATTVDDVFDTIEESIRDGADVDVEYHPRLGYPVRVVIDRDGDGVPDVHLEYGDLEMMPIVKTVQELQAAERRWMAQELDSYRYIFRFDCSCPESGTFEVDVRDGLVTDVRPLDQAARDSSIFPGVDIDASFDDLEKWFTNSSELIDEGILAVDVRMDPRYGYPRWFRIEGEDLDGQVFDGRFTMVVTIDLIAELNAIDPDTGLNAEDLAAVEDAVALWETAGLANYRYVIETHCECPAEVAGPFGVEVIGGVNRSVTWLTGEEAPAVEVASIEGTFELIGLAVADGTEVDVIYDHLYGFPEFAVIDPDAVAVDGGLAFSITEFEVLD